VYDAYAVALTDSGFPKQNEEVNQELNEAPGGNTFMAMEMERVRNKENVDIFMKYMRYREKVYLAQLLRAYVS